MVTVKMTFTTNGNRGVSAVRPVEGVKDGDIETVWMDTIGIAGIRGRHKRVTLIHVQQVKYVCISSRCS